jgi:hypothetical protein
MSPCPSFVPSTVDFADKANRGVPVYVPAVKNFEHRPIAPHGDTGDVGTGSARINIFRIV